MIFCPEHLDHTKQVETFSFCLDDRKPASI